MQKACFVIIQLELIYKHPCPYFSDAKLKLNDGSIPSGRRAAVKIKKTTASTYEWKFMPCFLTVSPSGSVYMEKSNGPRTDPCGTSRLSSRDFDLAHATDTCFCISDRYDLTQSRARSQADS